MSDESKESKVNADLSSTADSDSTSKMTMKIDQMEPVASGYFEGAESSNPNVVAIRTIDLGGEPDYMAQAVAAGSAILTIYSKPPGMPTTKSFIDVTVTA